MRIYKNPTKDIGPMDSWYDLEAFDGGCFPDREDGRMDTQELEWVNWDLLHGVLSSISEKLVKNEVCDALVLVESDNVGIKYTNEGKLYLIHLDEVTELNVSDYISDSKKEVLDVVLNSSNEYEYDEAYFELGSTYLLKGVESEDIVFIRSMYDTEDDGVGVYVAQGILDPGFFVLKGFLSDHLGVAERENFRFSNDWKNVENREFGKKYMNVLKVISKKIAEEEWEGFSGSRCKMVFYDEDAYIYGSCSRIGATTTSVGTGLMVWNPRRVADYEDSIDLFFTVVMALRECMPEVYSIMWNKNHVEGGFIYVSEGGEEGTVDLWFS